MPDGLEIRDTTSAVQARPVLSERDLILISSLGQSFPSSEQIATAEGIVTASLAELSRLSEEEKALVEPALRELCRNGTMMVFVGGATRRENLVFQMLGAHQCQRGNMTNLFTMPADSFRDFVRSIEAQAEAARSQGAIGTETGVVRQAIGVKDKD